MSSKLKLTMGGTFPSDSATMAEKMGSKFGLDVGIAIESEWFRDGTNSSFYNRLKEINKRRLYARGEQSVTKYKNEIAVEGDLSYLNLDWTPVPVIPKFVDVVVNGMNERMFKLGVYSQDALSQADRNSYQETLKAQMLAKPILDIIKTNTGADPFMMPEDEIPNTDEELNLHMQINYKPAIEIAEEIALNTIFDENDYNSLRKRFDYDITVVGMATGKHCFSQGNGVNIEYVDPASVVHSYTEDPYFKDVFYWGEVKMVHINELLKINPDLTETELEEIKQLSSLWHKTYHTDSYYEGLNAQETVVLLYYNYKTTDKVVYKKKIMDSGGEKVIEKDDTFNPPEEMLEEGRFEKISKTIDVWYEGVKIAGTKKLLKWEKLENMVRPKSSSQHALGNYVAVAPRMYKGKVDSLVKRMIPFADLIQMTHLKLQQVIARTVPDGVYIDADGLNEVDLGNGQAYNPTEALKLYFQTGSVVGRSFTEDGEYNHGKIPIQQLQSSSGVSKSQTLIGNYNHYLDMIRTVTGLNEARDASTPDPNSLVGLQKLAALNSNTATRHILDSSLFMYKVFSEALSLRISDILQYAPFKDDFINRIGKANVAVLDSVKELYLYDFGIFVEVTPDEEEKNTLEKNIQIALEKQDINLEDAIDIREIRNLKLANQYLKLKRKRKEEKDRLQAIEDQQFQAQANMESQRMAAQISLEKINAETQGKLAVTEAERKAGIEKLTTEADLKLKLMDREFQYNLQLNKMSNDNLHEREAFKEEEKAKRISQQNTQQSKIADQKRNGTAPINFESNEDSLDGFDMAEFDPR